MVMQRLAASLRRCFFLSGAVARRLLFFAIIIVGLTGCADYRNQSNDWQLDITPEAHALLDEYVDWNIVIWEANRMTNDRLHLSFIDGNGTVEVWTPPDEYRTGYVGYTVNAHPEVFANRLVPLMEILPQEKHNRIVALVIAHEIASHAWGYGHTDGVCEVTNGSFDIKCEDWTMPDEER